MPTVDAVIHFLEEFAPLSLAAEWDNVGLLLGDRAAATARIMTCLTVTPESAAEAVAERANLIVTHHPILFRPIQRLTTETADGRMLLSLMHANVAVYCPHTAFDNTVGGINDQLANMLDLTDIRPLRQRDSEPQVKIVVFVPDSDLSRVSDALFAAGAGHIGQYSQCSFRLSGTGTFFGSDAANPTVGQKGRREEVAEWRLEAICPEKGWNPPWPQCEERTPTRNRRMMSTRCDGFNPAVAKAVSVRCPRRSVWRHLRPKSRIASEPNSYKSWATPSDLFGM
jgi:dinuclear metal center YbgI/SA1388 family protein